MRPKRKLTKQKPEIIRPIEKKILLFSLMAVTVLVVIFLQTSYAKLTELYNLFSPKSTKSNTTAKVTHQLKINKSAFLGQIAKESGLSNVAKITICSLDQECFHWRGDQEPESVASLIKVPIAEVLLYKIVTEQINLQTAIYIDPDNFTEDSSDLVAEEYYPLGRLLRETIINSSNIAPNQIIDYLGWDYMNDVLVKQGYKKIFIASKFAGETTIPAGIEEWGKNNLTTNELTTMMVRIYRSNSPGDKLLVDLLSKQHDREFGFAALQGTKAQWLGEKTGQNSLAIGTTLALSINQKVYVITVIDDGNYTDIALRKCIKKIANYISDRGLKSESLHLSNYK